MDRAKLERLDRDVLIARAEAAGVTRARVLTRAELVDELILRSDLDRNDKDRSRGLFGRARDLLARVVERGLNLPDAADRIRAMGGTPPSLRSSAPAVLPTVTLAEIYTAQGHRDRAIETLERVLSREPDHAPARGLLAQLRDAGYAIPEPRLPPEKDVEEIVPETATEPEEGAEDQLPTLPVPSSLAAPRVRTLERSESTDDAHERLDECVALPIDATTTFVHWAVAASTPRRDPRGRPVIRVLVVVPTWDGPKSHVRDHEVSGRSGELVVRDLPAGAVVRVAVGLREGDAFRPVAHSPALSALAPAWPPGADGLLRWTPAGTLPLSPGDRDAAAIDRALARARSVPLEEA
ncbi:MAG TPA: tetratricopeptide repeat protein [Polyangiaceae bacterium]|nr:tetratricopeptide repeat protein [Polyangiaceae bacterium]